MDPGQARQTDSLVTSQIEAKYRGIATIISQTWVFLLKSKQIRIAVHSNDRVDYPFHKISSKSNGTVLC